MLKPSDLTKAELLQVVEMLRKRLTNIIWIVRWDASKCSGTMPITQKCRKLIDEEQKHYAAYFDLLRPYDGKPIKDIPQDVMNRALSELDKAKAAGQEWNRRNGIKLKERVNDEKMHR